MIVFGAVHVLLKHTTYMVTELFEHVEDDEISSFYDDFESPENVEKLSYVLGSEQWESTCKFDRLLSLVKEYILDIWKIRKHKLYDSDS